MKQIITIALALLMASMAVSCGVNAHNSLAEVPAKTFEVDIPDTELVIYKDDQDWFDFFANDAASFTPWADLSASVKNTYTFTDNCKPYGRVTIGANGKAVFVATRSRPNIPLRIMLQ